MDEFIKWMVEERQNRNWSQSKLASEMKVSQAAVSRVEAGIIPPTAKFAKAMAKAMSLPQEMAYRKAGILPPNEPPDPWAEEMAALVNSLQNPLYREAAQILIEGYVKKEEKERRKQGKQ